MLFLKGTIITFLIDCNHGATPFQLELLPQEIITCNAGDWKYTASQVDNATR